MNYSYINEKANKDASFNAMIRGEVYEINFGEKLLDIQDEISKTTLTDQANANPYLDANMDGTDEVADSNR